MNRFDVKPSDGMIVAFVDDARRLRRRLTIAMALLLLAVGVGYPGGQPSSGLTASISTAVSSRGVYGLTAVAAMRVPRMAAATATLLDGRVLAIGGLRGFTAGHWETSAEIYDPATNLWSDAGRMLDTRASAGMTTTVLSDGRVLVIGGYCNGCLSEQEGLPFQSVEVFDPRARTWSPAGRLLERRANHTATPLNDGRVLVAGGTNGNGVVERAEVFDPASFSSVQASSMSYARAGHRATRLRDGRVFVAGGVRYGDSLNSVEIYDPETDSWSPAPAMREARHEFAQVALDDGRIFVAGGASGRSATSGVEIFDPDRFSWQPAAPTFEAHARTYFGLLPSGRVMLVDPLVEGDTIPSQSQVFDPVSNTWSAAGPGSSSRFFPIGAVLREEGFIVAGGVPPFLPLVTDPTGVAAPTSDIYRLAGSGRLEVDVRTTSP